MSTHECFHGEMRKTGLPSNVPVSYSRAFCPGCLLLLAFIMRYRDSRRNICYHCALLNIAQNTSLTDSIELQNRKRI